MHFSGPKAMCGLREQFLHRKCASEGIMETSYILVFCFVCETIELISIQFGVRRRYSVLSG
jgi:hypothetical protein